MFPRERPRRLRYSPLLRAALSEHRIETSRLIQPLFVREGRGVREKIDAMPGQLRLSIDELVREAGDLRAAGIDKVLLFGIPGTKDAEGTGAYDEKGIVQRACRALREAHGDAIYIIADLCLCEYTDHGHCGILADAVRGIVDNDATLPLLARAAVSLARAGADMIAPSDMMDGRVAAIRAALDGAGFTATPILSYAVKYASAFYGPFREAAGSAPRSGDRRSYQMDPANAREARREAALDIEEGADLVMVKPGLPYLDVIARLRQTVDIPLVAYQVSGEYAMICAAGKQGWIDEEAVMRESLLAFFRAGCDLVITYFAGRVAGARGGDR